MSRKRRNCAWGGREGVKMGWSLHRGCCRRPAAAPWFPYIDFPAHRASEEEREWVEWREEKRGIKE